MRPTQTASSTCAVAARGPARLATAGSVDDGKSTLVGRLLHDTKSVLVRPARRRRAGQPRPRPDRGRPRAAHRRPARRARAGHHHRRRLPLLRHGQPLVRPRRLPRPRAVHPQHGHRVLDRRRRRAPRRRPQGRARADPAPPRRRRAAAGAARRRRRQQDRPRRLLAGGLRPGRGRRAGRRPRARRRRRASPSRSRPRRRQRRRPLVAHALVRRPQPARAARGAAAVGRPRARVLPPAGAARHPTRRARRATRLIATTAGMPARWPRVSVRVGDEVVALPSGRRTTVAGIDLGERSLDEAVRAAVGDAAPRRRDRHLAGRRHRRRLPTLRSPPRTSRPSSAGSATCRCVRASGCSLKHGSRTVQTAVRTARRRARPRRPPRGPVRVLVAQRHRPRDPSPRVAGPGRELLDLAPRRVVPAHRRPRRSDRRGRHGRGDAAQLGARADRAGG